MSEMTAPQSQGQITKFGTLAIFLILCAAVAASGAMFPPGDWYRSLVRPPLTPPGWLFGPVWTILYIMIAVSGWLVWSRGSLGKVRALGIYAIQLVLNAGWSAIFFGLQRPGLAAMEIACLWVSIVATIVVFDRHSRPAAALLIPYLLWVSFASYLNVGFWLCN
ncbi:MAG: tryptophan-rich sensory protein [Planctomycetaceae bacterium]|nr:tryptophan-rich sensory protein [Planctomycetaceae bacterium]